MCRILNYLTLPSLRNGLSREADGHLTKGKGKVVPVLLTEHRAMKAYWGSEGIASRIL
jgi:hypothetical protein